MRVLLAGIFLAPLIGRAANVTRVQLSAPILEALFCVLTQLPADVSGGLAQRRPEVVG